MVAQEDDELFPWLIDVENNAGDFLKNIGAAALRADSANYALIRSVLLLLKYKYPQYGVEERKRMIEDGWHPL